jgi:hypothetical protein
MKHIRHKLLLWVLLLSGLVTGCSAGELVTPDAVPPSLTASLEEVVVPSPTSHSSKEVAPEGVLLGVYPSGFLQNKVDELVQFDQWIEPTGKKITIAATFMDFEEGDDETFVPAELDAGWERGYVPFVNLSVGNLGEPRTAEHIAEGSLDKSIRSWARAYAVWSSTGGKRAFIAPLQEMNGYWTTYGGDHEQFLKAYHRIQNIFQEEGVDPKAVSWVFAPNGWAAEGYEFEKYYPGDEFVDVVAFSSFNWGECSNWPKWETYDQIFLPYLKRMTEMAPEKPIFIAEMGTVAEGGDKDQWITETFQKLSEYPNFHGILYFNRWEARATLENCPNGTDYRVFYSDKDEGFPSFLEAISSERFVSYSPTSEALSEIMDTTP